MGKRKREKRRRELAREQSERRREKLLTSPNPILYPPALMSLRNSHLTRLREAAEGAELTSDEARDLGVGLALMFLAGSVSPLIGVLRRMGTLGTLIHLAPEGEGAYTRCCNRAVLELPHTDRLTNESELSTCQGGVVWEKATQPTKRIQ